MAEIKKVKATEEVKKVNGDTLVPYRLFKDNDRYTDDVFVSVNNERILVKRGVDVMIKKKFADVLDQSQMQDGKTSDFIDEARRDYEEQLKNI